MIGPGHFLCGCNPNDPHVKNYSMNTVGKTATGEPILSGKRHDKHGREICPIHGQLMYGSASPQKMGPQGNMVTDFKKDFELRSGGKKHVEIRSTVADRRDNRDPRDVGAEFLARRASEQNGHSGKTVTISGNGDQ